MKHFPFILALMLSIFGSLVFIASAQNYVPLAPLPIGEGGTTPPSYNMTTYLSGAIKLLLAIGASLAILMTVIGGTQYVAAGISPDAKSKANEMITNSFIGLALMLVSYLILNSINPKLVQFDLSLKETKMNVTELTPLDVGLQDIYSETSVITPTTENSRILKNYMLGCAGVIGNKFTPFEIGLTTQEALNMETSGGTAVLWRVQNGLPDATAVQANLNRMKGAVDKLNFTLSKTGGSVKVNSAYRPYEYQKHLYLLWNAWEKQELKNNTDVECTKVKDVVGPEYSKHFGSGTSIVADPATGYAPHVRGTGVDLSLTGLPEENIKAFLTNNEIELCWQNIPGDKWHFNLKVPNRPCP